ncbi:MAG: hypothetical protein HY901_05680 [Deltaproteobacteria bacterium]|nr:hypothetical protein [Deltaproteobacteria bacterium]
MNRLPRVLLVACLSLVVAGCPEVESNSGADTSTPNADTGVCPESLRCGSTCCASGQRCIDDTCQTPTHCEIGQTACGNSCCSDNTHLCQNDTCVPKPTCPADETSCGSDCCESGIETCADEVCIGSNPGSCTIAATYGFITVNGAVQADTTSSGGAYRYMSGELPAADGTMDAIHLELYEGHGVFANGLATGTFTLEGDELNYATCSLCLTLGGDLTQSGAGQIFMATGGTVELASIEGTLEVTLRAGTFAQVTVDPQTAATTLVPNGCTTAIQQVFFHGTIPVPCDPLAPTACGAGEGCYVDMDTDAFACGPAGSVAAGEECTEVGQCVPGAECFGDSVCHKLCATASPGQCEPLESCDPFSEDGSLGACFECAAQRVCGNECCAIDEVCDATAGTCRVPTPCAPLAPTACGLEEGCYFNMSTETFVCGPEGHIAVGDGCPGVGKCVPGAECATDGFCHALCNPASPTCTPPDTCDPITEDGTLGLCFACSAAQICGSSCCTEAQRCDPASTQCVAVGPPSNDSCGANGASAIPLTLDAAPLVGSTIAATDDFGSHFSQVCLAAGGPSSTPGPDVVFVYTPAADGIFIVELVPQFDAVLWSSTGTCGGTGAECRELSDTFGNESIRVVGAVAGTSYYIHVDGYAANARGAFTIQVKSPPAAPANDRCGTDGADAIALTLNTTIPGDTSAAVDDYYYPISTSCDPVTSGQLRGNDVVFKYTPAASGSFTVTLTPTTQWDATLWYSVGSCGDPLACVNGADRGMSGVPESLTIAGVASTTYYLVVDGYAGLAKGPFSIVVQ